MINTKPIFNARVATASLFPAPPPVPVPASVRTTDPRVGMAASAKPAAASGIAPGRPNPNARHRWKRGATIEVTCDACGKSYLDYKARVRKAKRHFCCGACYHASKSGHNNPNYRARDLNRICGVCGRSFIDKSYTDAKFCSIACKHKSLIRTWSTEEAEAIIKRCIASGLRFGEFAESIGFSEFGLRVKLKRSAPIAFASAMESFQVKWSDVYRKGKQFEFRVRLWLISHGYVCMMSPRSLTPADLLAAKAGRILVVQCKHYKRIRRDEKEGLLEVAARAGGEPILATRSFDNQIKLYRMNPGMHVRKAEVTP